MKSAIQVLRSMHDHSITLSSQGCYYSLIWLHGLGDSPDGFSDYFMQQTSPLYSGGRIKLLQAPIRRVTLNNGAKMTSWYDIKTLAFKGKDQELFSIAQIKESLEIINKHVKQEIDHWKQVLKLQKEEEICKRIFIGGFSQGCAMSLLYGMTADYILAGIIGFSGHAFQSFDLKNKNVVPMLLYHGADDQMLNCKPSKESYDLHFGKQQNFTFTVIQDLGHSVTNKQLKESEHWIHKILKSNGVDK